MPSVTRPKHPSGHYFLFVRYWANNGQRLDAPIDAFVDTGASKCSIPAISNDRIFHLPIVDHDSNVRTASNPTGFDVVIIPRICLVAASLVSNQLQIVDTALEERNVSAWLGHSFILGMNFLSKFDVSMLRQEK